jgi:sugar/nucleoside kinase (ribokinase family)
MKRRVSKTTKGRDGVVCFGEVLLALSTSNAERFEQTRELEMTYTGAEADNAVAIANLGNRSRGDGVRR